MKQALLAALMLAACAGAACAQTLPTPSPIPVQAPMASAQPPIVPPPGGVAIVRPGTVPPLLPGCVTAAPPPPAPPAPPLYAQATLANALGIDTQKAAQIQAVFRDQDEQAQRIDQQRRDLDASTCRKLHAIVGDQGLAHWMSLAPPPPPPPPHGPGTPPPPPMR